MTISIVSPEPQGRQTRPALTTSLVTLEINLLRCLQGRNLMFLQDVRLERIAALRQARQDDREDVVAHLMALEPVLTNWERILTASGPPGKEFDAVQAHLSTLNDGITALRRR